MSKIHLSVDRYALIHKAVPAESQNPPQNSVEAVLAESQKESAPKFCGGSYRRISKRIRPKILWSQFPPNHKKNPPQKSVEAVPAKSQKESTPKNCGGSYRQISKRICPKNLWKQFLSNLKKISKRIRPKNLWRQFLPNLKKNPPKKESAPTLCGGSSRRISKRIPSKKSVKAVPAESQILLKRNPPHNFVEAVPAESQE